MTNTVAVDPTDDVKVDRCNGDVVQIIITDIVENRHILQISTADALHYLAQQLMYYSLTQCCAASSSEEHEPLPF